MRIICSIRPTIPPHSVKSNYCVLGTTYDFESCWHFFMEKLHLLFTVCRFDRVSKRSGCWIWIIKRSLPRRTKSVRSSSVMVINAPGLVNFCTPNDQIVGQIPSDNWKIEGNCAFEWYKLGCCHAVRECNKKDIWLIANAHWNSERL